ncbi:HEAT repeat protein, partial [Ostertagia ostertagi]
FVLSKYDTLLNKSDLKSIQSQLVQQLLSRLTSVNGPPIRYFTCPCFSGKAAIFKYTKELKGTIVWKPRLLAIESLPIHIRNVTIRGEFVIHAPGAANFHKDVYKAAKAHLADRVMAVRAAALQCVTALVPVYPPLYSTELEAVITLCTKALDGSNYETRLAVARLLAVLLSHGSSASTA